MAIQPARVDWWQIIIECCRHGHQPKTIALSIGVSKQALNGWKNNNVEPMYKYGERLIDLWIMLTGNKREDVPRVR